MIITIDGPSASGKSTVARMVAQRLGVMSLNTGILFRALAYLLIERHGYDQNRLSDPYVVDIQECLDPECLAYRYQDGHEHIFFDNADISPFLPSAAVADAASRLSQNSMVRALIMERIQNLAQKHDLVAEGRDMGTVVFPDADHKFYLTASLAVRAERWRIDQELRGMVVSQEDAVRILGERDERDSTRELSPLAIPEGALVIDTSDCTAEQVVERIMQKVTA